MTPEKREHFLTALLDHGNVTLAARAIGCSRQALYQARDADPDFAAAWEDARQAFADALEAEADRRAVSGVAKGVWYQGAKVGEEREYSDSLLMFRLKGLRPETYRERHEHTGPKGGPLQIELVHYADEGADTP